MASPEIEPTPPHLVTPNEKANWSQAISLKRIADALERQNDLTAQLWLKHGDDAKKPEITGALVNSQGEVSYTNKL